MTNTNLITIEDIRNPKLKTGFHYVKQTHGAAGLGHRYRMDASGGRKGVRVSGRGSWETPEEAAQVYCDRMNGQLVETLVRAINDPQTDPEDWHRTDFGNREGTAGHQSGGRKRPLEAQFKDYLDSIGFELPARVETKVIETTNRRGFFAACGELAASGPGLVVTNAKVPYRWMRLCELELRSFSNLTFVVEEWTP